MPADDALRLQAIYVRPRPVVLVSVEYAGGSNLFPMDLIGSLSNEKFTLALRSTSPAVALLRNSRRAVLADVPADRKSTAYDLGAHHKSKSIDWSSLPFSSLLSPNFSLRYPAFTSRVREMEIEEIFAVGSHTLFVCSQVHAEYLADTPQLHHTAGFYQAFRKRRAMAFPEA